MELRKTKEDLLSARSTLSTSEYLQYACSLSQFGQGSTLAALLPLNAWGELLPSCVSGSEVRDLVVILLNVIKSQKRALKYGEVPIAKLMSSVELYGEDTELILRTLVLLQTMVDKFLCSNHGNHGNNELEALLKDNVIVKIAKIIAERGRTNKNRGRRQRKTQGRPFELMMDLLVSILHVFTERGDELILANTIRPLLIYLADMLKADPAATLHLIEYDKPRDYTVYHGTLEVRAVTLELIYHCLQYGNEAGLVELKVLAFVLMDVIVCPDCNTFQKNTIHLSMFLIREQVLLQISSETDAKVKEVALKQLLSGLVTVIGGNGNEQHLTENKWIVGCLHFMGDLIDVAKTEGITMSGMFNDIFVRNLSEMIATLVVYYEENGARTCGHIIGSARILKQILSQMYPPDSEPPDVSEIVQSFKTETIDYLMGRVPEIVQSLETETLDYMIAVVPVFSKHLLAQKYHLKYEHEWALLEEAGCCVRVFDQPSTCPSRHLQRSCATNAALNVLRHISDIFLMLAKHGSLQHVGAMVLFHDVVSVVANLLKISSNPELVGIHVEVLSAIASLLGIEVLEQEAANIFPILWRRSLEFTKSRSNNETINVIRGFTLSFAPNFIDEIDIASLGPLAGVLEVAVLESLQSHHDNTLPTRHHDNTLPISIIKLTWIYTKRMSNYDSNWDWESLLDVIQCKEETCHSGLRAKMSTKEKIFKFIVVQITEYLDHPDQHELAYFQELTGCLAGLAVVTEDEESFHLEDLVTPLLMFLQTQSDKLVIKHSKSFIHYLHQ